MTTQAGVAPPSLARGAQDRYIWWSFHRHSRTFSLAARLLPRRVQLPVATLYLFCRTVDTIADERVLLVGPETALRELGQLRRKLEATLDGRPPAELLWKRLAEVHERFTLQTDPLRELLDGATWDLQGRRVETHAHLLDYANLVGGSIGAMMLPFLVATRADVARLERLARTLGVAMQLTNIVRDVGEDLRGLQRVYLPDELLASYDLSASDLATGGVPTDYPRMMEQLMESAEVLFEESAAGIDALPWKVRAGIRAAARMYREILNEVRARGYDNLNDRAYVPLPRKLRLVAGDDYYRRKERLLAPPA